MTARETYQSFLELDWQEMRKIPESLRDALRDEAQPKMSPGLAAASIIDAFYGDGPATDPEFDTVFEAEEARIRARWARILGRAA